MIAHQNGTGGLLANYTYTYDLASRVLTETLNGGTTTYSYDTTNQLTNDSTNTYTYDLNGNRTMTGYQTGTANQLQSDGTWTYSYDNEGNLTKKTKGASAETWTYGYDNLNHLTSAQQQQTDGGTLLMQATYTYDAFGNRLEKDVWTSTSGTTVVTRFGYDRQSAWADLNGTNQLVTRRIFLDGVDQLFARISSSGAAAWYLADRLGSVRDVTDATGAVQDHLVYDGYGNVITETNSAFGDRYKFTCRELDSETGLQYNRARYYDPRIGRWTSQDALGLDAGDTNLYRYIHNAPTLAIDPTGYLPTITVNLNFRVLYGATDTVDKDLKTANNVWAQAQIQFKQAEKISKDKQFTENTLGKDLIFQNRTVKDNDHPLFRPDKGNKIYVYYVKAINFAFFGEGGAAKGGLWGDGITYPPRGTPTPVHVLIGTVKQKENEYNYAIPFPEVLAHELGHSLGLDHKKDKNMLMYEFFVKRYTESGKDPKENFKLNQTEIDTARDKASKLQ